MKKFGLLIALLVMTASSANAGQGVWKTTPNIYGGWDTSYCSYCYKIGN